MRVRILGPEEWSKLKLTESPPMIPYLHPGNVAMVVAEDESEIVGGVTLLRATHIEGLWIDSRHRCNPGIMRGLIRQAVALAQVRGESWIFGGCADDRMRGFVERLGGVRMPMDFYALSVGGQECRQQ